MASVGKNVWDKGVYESGSMVAETADGGYVITANKIAEGSNSQIDLLKIDNQGKKIWEKLYSGQAGLFSKMIKSTSDGGYIIAGAANSEDLNRYYDFYLLKIKANGDVQWEKSFGNGNQIRDEFEDLVETPNGDFMLIGNNESSEYLQPTDPIPSIKDNIYYTLIGNDGTIKWQKTLKEDGISQMVKSLVKTSDGNYLAVGNKDTDSMMSNLLLFKFTPTGTILWEKNYGGDGPEAGYSVENTKDGGYVVLGFTGSYAAGGQYDFDMYLLKFNSLIEK